MLTLKGGAVAFGAEAVEFCLRLGSLVILARLLVPEDFGLISMVIAITAVADRFKDLGLGLVTVQRKEISHEQVSTLFWLNVLLGFGIFGVIAGCSFPIARFYDDQRLVPVTLALATTFFWGGVSVQHQALLRRQMAFGKLAVVQLSASVLSVLAAVALAMLGFGYWALVAREVLRSMFLALGSWVAFPWMPGRPHRGNDLSSMVSFGRDVTVVNLLWFFAHNIDQILVGKFYGAGTLGLYRQGINLVLAPIVQLYAPLSSVAEPALSRLQRETLEFRRYYVRFVGTVSSLLMPFVVLIAVFSEEIVLLALGSKWQGAAVFVRILAIASFLRPATSTAGFVLTSCGMSTRYLWWGALSSISLLLCVAVGSTLGVIGIAWGHVIATYFFMLPLLQFGFRGTPIRIRDFVKATIRPATASLIMLVALIIQKLGLPEQGVVFMVGLGVIMGGAVYAASWILLPGGRAAFREVQQSAQALLERRI